MTDTLPVLTKKVSQLELALGIAGITYDYDFITALVDHPIGSIMITTEDEAPTIGTWVQTGSGPLLGGATGTVYAWKRTA